MKPAITIVCSEPLRACMAGNAIRQTELARALAEQGFSVSLLAPQINYDEFDAPHTVTVLEVDKKMFAQQLATANVIIVQGHTADSVINLPLSARIVVDFYDPYLIENTSYFDELGANVFVNDLRNWRALCARGDYFLCATETQRLFYVGFLLNAGRIDAEQITRDPNLESLIGIVPFGVTDELPSHKRYLPVVTSYADSAQSDTIQPMRILFGGLYDWYDPFPVLEALNSSEFAHCELIFVRNPNPETTPQKRLNEVLEWCAKQNWSDSRLSVIDWVPYSRRFDLLRDVDVLIATHQAGLETSLSMRTRFLDALAVGCPVISSPGGGAAELIKNYNAGVVLLNNSIASIRTALRSVVAPPNSEQDDTHSPQQSAVERGQVFRQTYSWQQVIQPLIEYCNIDSNQASERAETTRSQSSKSFSVLLPTCNRMDTLPDVIAALEAQCQAPSFELIIVDDGSTDLTKKWLDGHQFTTPVKIIHQQNAGPAAARNAAIDAAQNDYLAFLGDDTVPDQWWLNAHYVAHEKHLFNESLVVVGHTAWHDAMPRTHFLRFLDSTEWQFGFEQIQDPDNLPFNYFYGSNLSLPRALLDGQRFSTQFPYPAWEDSEFGYRLVSRGARLVYAEDALTAHLHHTSLARFAQRQRKAGFSAMIFRQLHPQVSALVAAGLPLHAPPPVKLIASIRRLIAITSEAAGANTPKLWSQVLNEQYLSGIHDYLTQHNVDLSAESQQLDFPVVYPAASPVLQHHTGVLSEGRWVCRRTDHKAGHCVFGPSYQVPCNDTLRVRFFVQRLITTHDAVALNSLAKNALTIDVYDNRSDKTIAEQVVSIETLDESSSLDLTFDATTSQQLEFRLYWHAQCDIAFTKIVVERQKNDN